MKHFFSVGEKKSKVLLYFFFFLLKNCDSYGYAEIITVNILPLSFIFLILDREILASQEKYVVSTIVKGVCKLIIHFKKKSFSYCLRRCRICLGTGSEIKY